MDWLYSCTFIIRLSPPIAVKFLFDYKMYNHHIVVKFFYSTNVHSEKIL